MTEKEIVMHIDGGANFYVSLFGCAAHMETVDTGFYTYIKPKPGEHGITFIYNVRIEKLPLERQKALIEEMKSLRMPIWLGLRAGDELHRLIYGQDKVHGQTVFADTDEVYLALLPEEMPDCPVRDQKIVTVQTAEAFALWAKITNDALAGGYPDIHPAYHYPLCQKGLLNCYILYSGDTPAAVASIMDNKGIASLEFVATVPEMRRQGFAKAVCEKAVSNAFSHGAKIVTVRAIDGLASKLYQSVGFKVYNHAL